MGANWIPTFVNFILILLITAAPILVGWLLIRVLRKGIKQDRKAFEKEMRSRIGDIDKTQEEVKEQLDEITTR